MLGETWKKILGFSRKLNISIDRRKIEILYSRPSGPGGQGLNASNARVQLRFELEKAHDWLAEPVIAFLAKHFNRSVVVGTQDSRCRFENEKGAFAKLQKLLDLVEEHVSEPKKKFLSLQDFIYAVKTESQVSNYARRRIDSKRRQGKENLQRTHWKFEQ